MMVATAATAPLPAQLSRLKQEYLDARERARRLGEGLDAAAWAARPSDRQWSIGECLIHLNVTSEHYLPLIDDALREGRAKGLAGTGPFRRGLIGWTLETLLEPPYRIRLKTSPVFVPVKVEPMADVLERFDEYQTQLLARIDRSAGLALDRLTVVSPFDGRVRYNVYVAFRLVVVHQRRHLWQAEQVRVQARA